MVIPTDHVVSDSLPLSEIAVFSSRFCDNDSYLSHSVIKEQVLEEQTLDEEDLACMLDMLDSELMSDLEFENLCGQKLI